MNSHEELKQRSPRQIEIERLRSFPTATYDPHRPTGVLLSDEIEHYCKYFKLLDPYEPTNIKAANYELRVGFKYSVGGDTYELSKIGDVLRIPPFEVAVVEILETVNMPDFLIGRWNIRVRWAYKGLIWVGGPQVDAGYRGRISCPIWNLSNENIPIKCGEEIAVIDFVTTTPPNKRSDLRRYHWDHRTRYVFEDYGADKLKSALVTDAVNKIEQLRIETQNYREHTEDVVRENRSRVEGALERSNARIDTTTSVMFTALGVLIAAIAMFATKPAGAPQHLWDPTIFFLCWTTTTLTLFAWVRFQTKGKWARAARIWVGVLILSAIALQGVYQWQQSKVAHSVLQQMSDRISALEKKQPSPPQDGPKSPPPN